VPGPRAQNLSIRNRQATAGVAAEAAMTGGLIGLANFPVHGRAPSRPSVRNARCLGGLATVLASGSRIGTNMVSALVQGDRLVVIGHAVLQTRGETLSGKGSTTSPQQRCDFIGLSVDGAAYLGQF